MVKRKSTISPKPALNQDAVEVLLDQYHTDGDTAAPAQLHDPPSVDISKDDGSKGKAFPHRLSADFTTEQYKRLKRAGFETDQPMTTIVREAVENWLITRGY